MCGDVRAVRFVKYCASPGCVFSLFSSLPFLFKILYIFLKESAIAAERYVKNCILTILVCSQLFSLFSGVGVHRSSEKKRRHKDGGKRFLVCGGGMVDSGSV